MQEAYARAASIAAAYLGNVNISVPAAHLGEVITAIYSTIDSLENGARPVEVEAPVLVPAVSAKKSIQPDFLICLNDGVRLKSLKRHIHTKFGLSPDEYRRMWGLPADYPMVAPNYAQHRRDLAIQQGLGRKAAPVKTKKRAGAR